MSKHQKETIISLVSLLVVSTGYISYVFSNYLSQAFSDREELKYWASAFLLIIPIRLVLQIVLFILFKIFEGILSNGKITEDITDERDRIVELKGDWISGILFIMGFAFALFCVVFFNSSLSAMFAIILIAGYFSELIGIIAKMYFFKRGI